MPMKSVCEDAGPFCDEASIDKARQQLISSTIRPNNEIAFLVLSGSFNPVHTQHVRILELTKKHLENLGWKIIAGFMAPSSEAYVEEKLGKNALSLNQRISLCKLATQLSDWISVCCKGSLSSNWVRRSIKSELQQHFFDIIKAQELKGVELMGSDTVIRIFSKVLAQNKKPSMVSTQHGRVIRYSLRPGMDRNAQKKRIEDIEVDASALGVELVHVEQTHRDPPLESISSTAIRELISKGDWETLRSKNWLPPVVLETLETWDM